MGGDLKHIYNSKEVYSTHKGETYNAYPLFKKINYQVFKETEILSLFALCGCDNHNLKQLREERV